MTSMLLEVDILGRDRVPVRNWHRSSVLAKPNEDDEAVSRQFHYPGRGVARSDMNADMHAGRPGVDQTGLDLDKVTYPQRPIEAHPPAKTATLFGLLVHCVASTCAASSIQRITMPP